jgi:hypothetical protein
MGFSRDHTTKAQHNGLVASQLLAGKSAYDWAVVALFYMAVHLVDAQAARKRRHPGGHAARGQFVFENWPEMEPTYTALHQRSEQARYECGLMGPSDVTNAQQYVNEIKKVIETRPVAQGRSARCMF